MLQNRAVIPRVDRHARADGKNVAQPPTAVRALDKSIAVGGCVATPQINVDGPQDERNIGLAIVIASSKEQR